MKVLKSIAASGAALLAAGCVAYPYYDDPYYGDGYAYRPAPAVTYARPTVTYYYDYEYNPPRRYYYREGRRYYSRDESRGRTSSRDDDRGRYWRDREHRYYDGQ